MIRKRLKYLSVLFACTIVMSSFTNLVLADETDGIDADQQTQIEEECQIEDDCQIEEEQDIPGEEEVEEPYQAEADEPVSSDDLVLDDFVVYEEYPEEIVIDDDDYIPSRSLVETSTGSYRYKFTGIDEVTYQLLKQKIEAVARGDITSTVFDFSFAELGLTKTTWTAEELGVDSCLIVNDDNSVSVNPEASAQVFAKVRGQYNDIIGRLLVECPFDFYWYNKTQGAKINGYGVSAGYNEISLTGSVKYSFTVSDDYSSGSYKISSSAIALAKKARAKAEAIVSANADKSDYEKLIAYKEAICNLTDYNHPAAAITTPGYYGNPWQCLYVFDEDPDTMVVCEGYSKAFKFLCDLTDFDSSEITCVIASGDFVSSSGTSGPHMWNIVSFGSGLNYMVDVTNCDSGSIGYPELLFLKSPNEITYPGKQYKYICKNVTLTYKYADKTLNVINSNTLTLSSGSMMAAPELYLKNNHQALQNGVLIRWDSVQNAASYKIFRKTAGGNWVLVTETSSTRYVDIKATEGETYYYGVRCVDSNGNYMNLLSDDYSIKYVLTHVHTEGQAQLPDCTHDGHTAGVYCSICKKCLVEPEVIPATGHNIVDDPAVEPDCEHDGHTAGCHCSTCGEVIVATEKIPAKGHTEVIDPAVEATPLHTGLTEGSHCSVCGKVIREQQVLPIVSPLVNAEQNSNGIKLTWNAINGAAKYRVYRKTAGTKWAAVKTTTDLSYIDTNVENGVEYFYGVVSIDSAGTRLSGICNEVSIRYVAPVPMLVIDQANGTVVLGWTAVEGAAKYRVYRKTADTKWASIKTTTNLMFIDSDLTDGVEYFYGVVCIDSAGNRMSGVENALSIVYAAPPSKVPNVTAVLSGEQIQLSWNAIDGAAKYRIYRKTAGTKWASIKTTTALTYTDTGLTDGVEYFYGVVCLDSDGNRMGSVENEISITYTAPAVPSVTLKQTNSGIKVNWTSIDGAAKYRVYKKVDGGKWVSVKTTTGLSFTDTDVQGGVKYTYGVVGIDASGNRMGSVKNEVSIVYTVAA